jgi:hypothetical protein
MLDLVHPKVSDAEVALRSQSIELDRLESAALKCPRRECPVTHIFTDGLYIRQILMPAGPVDDRTLVFSEIHKTQHPYVVTRGKVAVFTVGKGWEVLTAPFQGITEPGARRALLILEDTVWTTYHPNPSNERNMEKLRDLIIYPHTIQLEEIDIQAMQQLLEGGASQ